MQNVDTTAFFEGEENGTRIMEAYLKLADIVIIVCDVTSQSSFDDVKNYSGYIEKSCLKHPIVIVAGNKDDRVRDRFVSSEEAHAFFRCRNPPLPYMEVSALTGNKVEALFETAVHFWLNPEKAVIVNKNDNNNNNGNNDDPSKCIIN